jgi:hypothetical protein
VIGIPGVTLRRVDALPHTLDGAAKVGPYSSARPGVLLRVVPGVGRFLARDGNTLEYWTEEGADEAAVEALLQGGVLGALIHQRGELPLHATTLVSPDRTRAIALAGHSGAGKSTTAYELVRRGWILLSDDLTRVTLEDGRPTAWPGKARLRLLTDACDAFELDVGRLAAAPDWRGKYLVDLPRWEEPMALTAVVALERSDELALDVLRGVAALRVLAEQTYRIHYVEALGQTRKHFELIAATAAGTTVLRARRGRSVADSAARIVSATAQRH